MTEHSADGNPIWNHKERVMPEEIVHGDEALIRAVSEHIELHLGPIEMVFHEIVSDLVHIDVNWVKPTPERNFHTLITCGMSERAMAVPEQAKEFRYAELVVHLPPEWPLDMESFKDERHYWPIRMLKSTARMPHEYQTFLFPAHTIGDPEAGPPLGAGTEMSGILIGHSPSLPDEFGSLVIDPRRTIRFYTLIPLYREEINFKLQNGIDKLFELFIEANRRSEFDEIINPRRKNLCAPTSKADWWKFWKR